MAGVAFRLRVLTRPSWRQRQVRPITIDRSHQAGVSSAVRSTPTACGQCRLCSGAPMKIEPGKIGNLNARVARADGPSPPLNLPHPPPTRPRPAASRATRARRPTPPRAPAPPSAARPAQPASGRSGPGAALPTIRRPTRCVGRALGPAVALVARAGPRRRVRARAGRQRRVRAPADLTSYPATYSA